MSCILYKDGNKHLVRAEFVEHMKRRGYSDTPVPSSPPRENDEAELQADLALAVSDKPRRGRPPNANKNQG